MTVVTVVTVVRVVTVVTVVTVMTVGKVVTVVMVVNKYLLSPKDFFHKPKRCLLKDKEEKKL